MPGKSTSARTTGDAGNVRYWRTWSLPRSPCQSDRCPAEFNAVQYSIDEVGAKAELLPMKLDSRAIAVGLNRFTAFHHMKFDAGGGRTRW